MGPPYMGPPSGGPNIDRIQSDIPDSQAESSGLSGDVPRDLRKGSHCPVLEEIYLRPSLDLRNSPKEWQIFCPLCYILYVIMSCFEIGEGRSVGFFGGPGQYRFKLWDAKRSER